MYDTLIRAVETYFDEIKVLKRGARGTVKLVRHRDTGKRYIFRCFDGSDEVYRRLLTVDCPYLPRIEEAAASCGRVAVLEEYVQGDTLLYLLEGSVLDWSEARKVAADICGALWVLHSMGAVHRDVKETHDILSGMIEKAAKTAEEMELFPYYLYRQKNIAGNFENVGYAKVDKAGIYNILIMEEKQSIIAAGAGASTKIVLKNPIPMPGSKKKKMTRLIRQENVKAVDAYIDRIDEMIERKGEWLWH